MEQTDIKEIVKHYEFTFDNKTIIYPPEEIIHTNEAQVRIDNTEYLKGVSRIQPLTQACENVITAYEARGILEGNSPLGIISNQSKDQAGAITFNPKEKEQLQEEKIRLKQQLNSMVQELNRYKT